MLPFEPEPMTQLQARYKKGLERPYDAIATHRNPAKSPGLCRDHVFDCLDGMRLAVSITVYPNNGWVLEISAGAQGPEMKGQATSGILRPEDFCSRAVARFREISGNSAPIFFEGFHETKGYACWTQVLAGTRPTADQMVGWGLT